MKFEVRLVLYVDPEANFIEADLEDMERVMKEIVSSAMYDVDDVTIEECEVEEC